jgi:hypothetical protein
MSVHAGNILHVGGNNVIDRIQSAGLTNAQNAYDVIREIGNDEVVDKVPQDPDYTFSVETFDVSTEIEAWLTGKVGTDPADPTAAPGAADAAGTEYRWADCEFVNVASPWKEPGAAGDVLSGHLVPAYYPTRISYSFGVTDNASQTVELSGGSYYYGEGAPVEQFETGDGAQTAFLTDDPAIGHRIGGALGTTFKRVFGVLVNGVLQVEGIDYTEASPAVGAAAGIATITFLTPPAIGADIRFGYFTNAATAFPQPVHPSTLVKPAAVRGRNICVFVGSGVGRVKLGGVQAATLDATVDGAVEREFCNTEIVGRTINGRDTNGDVTVRSKDRDAFFALLAKVTGLARGEVVGNLNQFTLPLEIQIQNPKNPAQILKTLYVDDAIFSVPGTPARVNTPTDFALHYESQSGTYSAFKGAKP